MSPIAKRILYLQSSSSVASLAEACFLLTPKVTAYAQEIFLEISETQKFFGGEEGLLQKFNELALSFDVKGKVLLVDRPEWARMLAEGTETRLPVGKSKEVLFSLPVDRLKECGDPATLEEERVERERLVAFMRRVGIRSIGEFAKLPASATLRRFGKLGISLREWVLGNKELVLPVFTYEEAIHEKIDTDEVTSLESLLFYIRQLLVRVEHRLIGRSQLAKEMRLTFYLESGIQLVRPIPFSEPQRNSVLVMEILREVLSSTTWDSPLQRFEIEVNDTIPYVPAQLFLWETGESKAAELSQFVTKLRVRYGNEAVGIPENRQSYLPEFSWEKVWPPSAEQKVEKYFSERPFLLYPSPKPVSVPSLRTLFPSETVENPWEKKNRRYFIAENPQGEKIWVFHEANSDRWFLHGVFD
jgi:protein ImuB